MSGKLSPKRVGLLRLIADDEAAQKRRSPESDHVGAYLPGCSATELRDYGLTTYDTFTVTMAAKAGLITERSGFAKLTDAGRAILPPSTEKGEK